MVISPKDDLLEQLRLLHEAAGEIPPDAMVELLAKHPELQSEWLKIRAEFDAMFSTAPDRN